LTRTGHLRKRVGEKKGGDKIGTRKKEGTLGGRVIYQIPDCVLGREKHV